MSEALSAKEISGGVVHDLPADLKMALTSDAKALETWEDITPLARNEWICWIKFGQKGRNKNSPDRMGLFQPQRRKAETLLLAWLSASLRSTTFTYQKGEQALSARLASCPLGPKALVRATNAIAPPRTNSIMMSSYGGKADVEWCREEVRL